MPSYREHVATGCVVYIAASLCLHHYMPLKTSFRIELFLFTLVGALFPDIDTKSKGQQLIYMLILLLTILLVIQKYITIALTITLCAFLPLLCKHRGLFHDPVFLLFSIGFISIILLSSFPTYKMQLIHNILFFTCGVLSHIILDNIVTSNKHKARYYRR